MAGMEIHDSRTTVAGGRERQTASLKILNVQKLLGQEPTRSRVVPPPAGVAGDLKTMEQQDPSLSSQTISVKATRIAAMTHDPPKRFMEIDKNLIIINGDIFHPPSHPPSELLLPPTRQKLGPRFQAKTKTITKSYLRHQTMAP